MDFLSPLISMIDGIISCLASRISHVVNLDNRVDSLMAALKDLKGVRDDKKGQVDRAESVGLTCTNQVKGWLERVGKIEADVDLIVEEVQQPSQCFCPDKIHCCSRYKASKRVSKMLSDINELMNKKPVDVILANGSPPARVEEVPSRPTIGLDVMLEKMQQCLRQEDLGIIGIYGMGGVGKTTLLKNINNKFLTVNHNFDVVIWVVVSRDFVVEKIQQAIGARLGLSWDEIELQESRASKLYKVMRRMKVLLLLDDVWERIDLVEIGIPLPSKENKCKVVFTSRSMNVCSDMDADYKLKMEFLKEEESWLLFSVKLGRSDLLNFPSIRHHAETIIRKCGGLPLALITMGRAMSNKETAEEWKYAIQMLNKSPSELRGMSYVFALLKFSYDCLENDMLRFCLLYCALYPEDYLIEKEQLIEYWLGEGFLDGSHDSDVYNMGHAIIGSLKVACLLETGEEETQIKMHDVVRNFALWIASDCGLSEKKNLVEASEGLNEAPSVEYWEGAVRISLMDNGITELCEVFVCPHLTTLMLQWNSGLNKICSGFFQFMPSLKVLDLSFTSIKEIPVSICNLVELRHLDLSGTKLSKLPQELGGLKKLKHLDLQRTHYLRTIPRDAVSGLSQLRVLNFYYSNASWEVQDLENENEVSFSDLTCLRHLNTLGITITELTTLKRLSGFNTLLKCIQYLYIKQCEGLLYLHLTSPPGHEERLRRLSINNCPNLKNLIISACAGNNWLPELEVLALYGLPNLSTVWSNPVTKGSLQNLRSINIWYCHQLKNISWILWLQKLEMIYLFYCNEMVEVISEDEVMEEGTMSFPSLKTISIRGLPELACISQWEIDFPSLERIAVVDCPKLRKLSLKALNESTPPIMYGDKEWWHNLDWEEDKTNFAFYPHFIAT